MHYISMLCLLLFAATVVTNAKKKGYDEEAIQKGDSYIDKMLEDMFNNKEEEYDPYELEDSAVGFHRKVMFVNVSGEAKLHDGYIKGLSTLHRAKHCSLHKENNKLRVKADLGAGELEMHYKGTVKFMNYGPTITVTGTLSYIEVFMEFTVDSETGRDGKLTKFVIDDMRGMKVRVSGLGPINWAVNPIISGVTKVFKRFVRNFMENKVEKHLKEHIPNYQFPVEGGETTETPETIPTQTEEPEETTPTETLPPDVTEATEPETEATETEATEPETEATETEATETEATEPEATEPETEATEPETEATEPETVPPDFTDPEPEPETEAPEPEPETEAPEPETEAPEPETEAPEPEPETEAPEPEPETEAPEPEPETEAPEPEPETEAPEPEPETEAPEPEPETEAPEPEPETEAPEPEPETEAPEPEPEMPDEP